MGSAASVKSNEISEFNVDLRAQPPNMVPTLPQQFTLKLSAECVEICDITSKKILCDIVYTDVESWTKKTGTFSLNLAASVLKTDKAVSLSVSLPDDKAATLQKNILAKITMLMDRMATEGYTIKEFTTKLKTLLDESNNLKPSWTEILGAERKLTVFQAQDIYRHLQSQTPFDRIDSICHLYTLLLNKSMFQILVNSLDKEGERDNVLHRLNLHQDAKISREASNVTFLTISEPTV